MEILETLIILETMLHSRRVRTSYDDLNHLLASEYSEIGASGKLYNKEEAITILLKSEPIEIKSSDFHLNELSNKVMQLIYTTEHRNKSETISKVIRSSLWKNSDDKWQMIFHQGTIDQK